MATVGLRRKPLSTAARWEAMAGYLFISPWLIGLLVFILGPIIASFYLSLTESTSRCCPSPPPARSGHGTIEVERRCGASSGGSGAGRLNWVRYRAVAQ